VSAITTHVLDTSEGHPAGGVPVELETRTESGEWRRIGHGATDSDGRLRTLMSDTDVLVPGAYRLTFDVSKYFEKKQAFYSRVTIEFNVSAGELHYHVPLLISPFGYTTYRGS
jgi:5-hydroxyisourate hydrolase